MTEQYEKVSVSGKEFETVESGTYPAELVKMPPIQTSDGPRALWVFLPEGEDIEVAGFTSLSQGSTSKAMEWARRILGKSDATDEKWGKDLKNERRPIVGWGEDELKGKPCRVVVEKYWDDEIEVYRNRVTNVLPSANGKGNATSLRDAQAAASDAAASDGDPGATASDPDFEDIPF